MDTAYKFVELFSHNWIILIISLFVVSPLIRLAIKSYVDLKIARITNHSKFILHVEDNGIKKSLEISSSEVNFKDLNEKVLLLESSDPTNRKVG